MTATHPLRSVVRDAVSEPVPGGTRLERRAALDLSIDEELVRGELRGEALSEPQRAALAILVEHELSRTEPLAETRFLAALPGSKLFSSRRRGRQLTALLEMNLARREDGFVSATVAGLAAILQLSTHPERRPEPELLRALRRVEISSIRL